MKFVPARPGPDSFKESMIAPKARGRYGRKYGRGFIPEGPILVSSTGGLDPPASHTRQG